MSTHNLNVLITYNIYFLMSVLDPFAFFCIILYSSFFIAFIYILVIQDEVSWTLKNLLDKFPSFVFSCIIFGISINRSTFSLKIFWIFISYVWKFFFLLISVLAISVFIFCIWDEIRIKKILYEHTMLRAGRLKFYQNFLVEFVVFNRRQNYKYSNPLDETVKNTAI